MRNIAALNSKKYNHKVNVWFRSIFNSKRALVVLLISYLLISNGSRIKLYFSNFDPGEMAFKKYILALIAVTDIVGILMLIICHRASKCMRQHIDLAVSLLAIIHISLVMMFLRKKDNSYTGEMLAWTEIILVICTMQHMVVSTKLNILIFASIQIQGFIVATQDRPFDIINSIYPFILLLLMTFLLYFREHLKAIFTNNSKNCQPEQSLWKNILNDLSDLVLVLRENEELYYVNRATTKDNNTFKDVIEPYSKLENLRFKEENVDIRSCISGGTSPESSQTVLLKNSGVGFNDFILREPESTSRDINIRRNRDSLNSRRSFCLIEDQSPPSALRKKRIKESQKINMNLQGIIQLFLSDINRLEIATRQKSIVLIGNILNLPQVDNFGDAERDSSIFEIKFSVSRLNESFALIIVISETTNYHMVSKLEEVTKYKNNILGSFSHVLRTPLNGIINFLTVAKDKVDIPFPVIESIINPAITCSQQLMYLINDILDYSQLSLKSFTLNISLQEIRPAIEEVLQLFETETRLKGIGLKFDVAKDTPKLIRTDFTRLKQIMINLLKSCLNHTFSGEIVLSVSYVPNDNQLIFTLKGHSLELRRESKMMFNRIFLQNELNEAGMMNIMNEPLGENIGLVISSRLAKLLGPKENAVGIKYKSDSVKFSEFDFIIEDKPDGVDFLDIHLISNAETPGKDQQKGTILSKLELCNQYNIENISQNNRHQSENFEFDDLDKEALAEEIRNESPKRSSVRPEARKTSFNISTQATKTRVSGISSISSNQPKNLQKNSFSQSKFAPNVSIPRVLCFCSCKTVLIVDDDAFNILSLGELLKSLGVSYEESFNGEEAIDMIAKKQRCCEACRLYSMIFMDCNMPVKDGYETTKILKKKMFDGEISFIPIVACTAYIIDYQSSRCAEVGMDDYICKPVNKAILLSILKRWEVIF